MSWAIGTLVGLVVGFVAGVRAAISYAREQVRQHQVDRILASSVALGLGDKNTPPHVLDNLKRMRQEQAS